MSLGDIKFVRFASDRQPILTSTQMRAAEQSAINAGTTTGLALMETAAQGVVDALLLADPPFASGKYHALVLCGPGNNGGDGFAIARLLQGRGWTVDASFYGVPTQLPADAATNAQLWLETNITTPIENVTDQQIAAADVVVDALFGTGLKRPVSKSVNELLERVANSPATVVAVDVPTGIHSDTGQMLREQSAHLVEQHNTEKSNKPAWPRVDHTVTFQRLKPAHLLAASRCDDATTLSIVDLGIEKFEPNQSSANAIFMAGTPPNLSKQNLAHKYEHGHAVVFAGDVGKGGAGRLAAHAALRTGAGAVTLACPTSAVSENAAQLNAIMLTPVNVSDDLKAVLSDKRKTALCLGPGIGVSDYTCDMVLTALRSGRATVLDADALTSFASDRLTLCQATHPDCVLTPHEGEFGRLFPDLSARMKRPFSSDSRIDMVREAAVRANCVVLLKGAVTIMADPAGQVEVSVALGERSVPWLATAGSGDVLAGFIAGFLARGFAPMAAASAGAWLHIECAKAFGPGLIAEDLPNMVPRVLSEWESQKGKGETAQ